VALSSRAKGRGERRCDEKRGNQAVLRLRSLACGSDSVSFVVDIERPTLSWKRGGGGSPKRFGHGERVCHSFFLSPPDSRQEGGGEGKEKNCPSGEGRGHGVGVSPLFRGVDRKGESWRGITRSETFPIYPGGQKEREGAYSGCRRGFWIFFPSEGRGGGRGGSLKRKRCGSRRLSVLILSTSAGGGGREGKKGEPVKRKATTSSFTFQIFTKGKGEKGGKTPWKRGTYSPSDSCSNSSFVPPIYTHLLRRGKREEGGFSMRNGAFFASPRLLLPYLLLNLHHIIVTSSTERKKEEESVSQPKRRRLIHRLLLPP